ncbi:MAG: hypothetical protein HZC02_04205 [Candidatus Levybacteria bacterium]|nr:hypothetical protein [Candidatus Levybacteria bacterium]
MFSKIKSFLYKQKDQFIIMIFQTITIASVILFSIALYGFLSLIGLNEPWNFYLAVIGGLILMISLRAWATWSYNRNQKEESDGSTASS